VALLGQRLVRMLAERQLVTQLVNAERPDGHEGPGAQMRYGERSHGKESRAGSTEAVRLQAKRNYERARLPTVGDERSSPR
jgi:hypothetical protein